MGEGEEEGLGIGLLQERVRCIPARRKISACVDGGGGEKEFHASAINQATLCTVASASQGFLGRGVGMLCWRMGRKMGEEMMWAGNRRP